MVVRNITTNKNCGNSNNLLHRLRHLVAIHIYLLQWSWQILQPNNTVAIISSNSNTVLFGYKSTKQLQCQSILMQLNVIMAILITNSNTFQKSVAICLTSCNAERKNCNALFLWQHSPFIATFLDKCCKTRPLLQHNLWWCKWHQVAIGSKSSSVPNIFKRLLIFNYKFCQAPNYTTKNSKNTSGGREAQMWCVLEESTTHAYIVSVGRSSAGKFGNRLKPTKHGCMQPPERGGPERRR
jgi:hypothetical protein